MAVVTHRKLDSAGLPIGDRTVQQLSHVFRLLADNSRLRSLLLLARSGELHVSALCNLLHESQPAVSHHLTLLRMANLVGYRREVTAGAMHDLLGATIRVGYRSGG